MLFGGGLLGWRTPVAIIFWGGVVPAMILSALFWVLLQSSLGGGEGVAACYVFHWERVLAPISDVRLLS